MNAFERKLPVVNLKPAEMCFTAPSDAGRDRARVLSVGHDVQPPQKAGRDLSQPATPVSRQDDLRKGCGKVFKYVDCSIRHMVRLFDRRNVKRSEIEVKCFGAADMFLRKNKTCGIESVGNQNVKTAEEVILSEGLSILKIDIGGLQGRKILFYTDTGDVLLKRLS